MAGTIQNLKQDAVAQIYFFGKKTTSKRSHLGERAEQLPESVVLHLYFFPKEGDDEVCVTQQNIGFVRIFTSFLLLGNKIASLLTSCCIQSLTKSLKK